LGFLVPGVVTTPSGAHSSPAAMAMRISDVYPTLAPIKASGRRSEIRMRLDLNAHKLIDGITRSDGPF